MQNDEKLISVQGATKLRKLLTTSGKLTVVKLVSKDMMDFSGMK